jgi:hypothetical protein
MLKAGKKHKDEREFTTLTYKLYGDNEKNLLKRMEIELEKAGIEKPYTRSKGIKLAIEKFYNIKLEN